MANPAWLLRNHLLLLPGRQDYTHHPSQPQTDEAMLKTLEIRSENPSCGTAGTGSRGCKSDRPNSTEARRSRDSGGESAGGGQIRSAGGGGAKNTAAVFVLFVREEREKKHKNKLKKRKRIRSEKLNSNEKVCSNGKAKTTCPEF